MSDYDHKWRALARFAKNSKMLALLDPPGLGRLVAHGEIVLVPSGAVIVRQGEVGDTFYLLIDGEVSVRVHEAGGAEVARLGPGSFFGEIAVVTRQPRTATVVALTQTELIRFPRQPLVDVVRDYPRLREVLSSVGLARSEDNLRRAMSEEEEGLAGALEGEVGDAEPGLAELLEGEGAEADGAPVAPGEGPVGADDGIDVDLSGEDPPPPGKKGPGA